MKKIFSLLVAIAFCGVASAQITWGYYEGENSEWSGLGTGSSGTFHVAIYVPGEIFGGATLQGINIPVVSESMKSVSAWARTKLSGSNVKKVSVSSGFTPNEYTPAMFDEGYTIPEEGLYVGYTFTSSAAYPIAVGPGKAEGALFLKVGSYSWEDYWNEDFGVSPIQIIVNDLKVTDNTVTAKNLTSQTLLPNTPFKTSLTLINVSNTAIKNIDYTIDVDGQKEAKHLDLSEELPAGVGETTEIEVEGVSASEAKAYPVTVQITNVNGQPNSKNAVASTEFQGVTRVASRRTVVEEYTGTGCGYCPRGWVGMEYLKEKYQDIFVGIAFHKYNSTDPMYVANYYPTASLGITGAPGCNMDRKKVMDPFYGANYSGIWNDLLAYNAILPTVDLTAKGYWNEDKTAVDITTDVDALSSGLGFSVAYVLTADGLSGTTSSWRQANYYASTPASNLPSEPDLAQFGSGGVNGQSYVYLTFNDVMIGSSYDSSGKNLAEVISGADNALAGTTYTGSYQIKMPTKTALKNAINTDQVFANVLVIDNKTGFIMNAVRVKVEEAPEVPDAINEVQSDDNRSEVARYRVDGQPLSAPQRGLNVIRMANGKTAKVIVK